MRVQDIMNRQLTYCTPEWSLMKVANLMLERGLGEIPVVVNHVPVGMITDRDIVGRVVANAGNPLALLVGEIMTKVVVSVRSDASLKECHVMMEENKLHRMPVVSPQGKICGVIGQGEIGRSSSDQTADILSFISEPSKQVAEG